MARDLTELIIGIHRELKKLEPNNPLLGLISYDRSIAMYYTAEFGRRYEGMTVGQGLARYAQELERALKKNEKRRV